MQIAKPQVHLRKNTSLDVYQIHVVTWFDHTKFVSDGVDSINTTPASGVFYVVLKVAENGSVPQMQLLTPVVHTVTLTDVELGSEDPFVEVTIINSSDNDAEVGKRRTHKDDADDSAMPSPRMK